MGMPAHAAMTRCAKNLWCRLQYGPQQNGVSVARSWVGDYNDRTRPHMTVFNKTTDTMWRPILLDGPEVGPYGIYITVWRTGTGIWVISPWSYCCNSMLQQIRIKLELFKMPTHAGWETALHDNIYTYEGGVVSSMMSEEQARVSGRLLLLNDGQVHLMRKGVAIFEFKVTVTLTPPPLLQPGEDLRDPAPGEEL